MDPTPILTGSSVSTLVASAAAAAVWNTLPWLSADEVMDYLYLGGEDLRRTADYCLFDGDDICAQSGSLPGVRRASVCTALQAACLDNPSLCLAPQCALWPSLPSSSPNLGLPQVSDIRASSIVQPYVNIPACAGQSVFYDPLLGPAPDPCPNEQYHGLLANPWVNTQPASAPCPTCIFFRGQGRLYLEIDSEFSGFVSNPALSFCGQTLSLSGLNLSPGVINQISDLNLQGCSNLRVSFKVGWGRSASSEVMIWP
jgi:hypothetical protein